MDYWRVSIKRIREDKSEEMFYIVVWEYIVNQGINIEEMADELEMKIEEILIILERVNTGYRIY